MAADLQVYQILDIKKNNPNFMKISRTLWIRHVSTKQRIMTGRNYEEFEIPYGVD